MLLSLLLSLLLQEPEKPAESQAPEKKVVVTGTRHESDILDVPSAMTVIDRAEIEKSSARTVVDLLQGRPGLTVTKNSSTPQDAMLDFRGFNNGAGAGPRTMVLVDGRKVNGVTTNATDWAAIPLDNVERIEIVRGPAAALYGDGAVAAVVNILTRRAGEKARHFGGVEGGSFDAHRETAAYSILSGIAGVSVFASKASSDGFRDNSAFDGLDTTATVDLDLGGARAWIKFSAHDDFRERPGTLTKAEIDAIGRDGTVTQGDESDVDVYGLDLGADGELGGGTLTPQFGFTRDLLDAVTTGFGGTFSADDKSSKAAFALKYVRAFGAVTIAAGGEFALESAEAASAFVSPGFASTTDAEYERQIFGAFARAEWRLTDRLIVTGSLRYDQAAIDFERTTADTFTPATTLEGDKDFSNVAPHAGWIFHLTPLSSVYASAGKTFRLPNRDELVGFVATALDLDPERARVYEIGARTRQWAVLGGSVAFYWIDVHNEIFFNPPAVGEDVSVTFNFGQNVNVDWIRHRGVEFEVVSSPHEGWELFGSLTIQRTEVLSGPHEGEELPLTPNVAALLGARTLVLEGLTAQAAVRYAGERYLTNDIANTASRLDDYAVVDLKIAYKRKAMSLFAQVDNVLDKEYFDNGGLRIVFGVFPGAEAFNPAPGRSYLFGVSVEF